LPSFPRVYWFVSPMFIEVFLVHNLRHIFLHHLRTNKTSRSSFLCTCCCSHWCSICYFWILDQGFSSWSM